jgi:hypothetical protein
MFALFLRAAPNSELLGLFATVILLPAIDLYSNSS